MTPHNRRDVVRLLQFLEFSSAGGRHEKFVHADGRHTHVPFHTEVSAGVCRRIVNDLGMQPRHFDLLVGR